MRLPGSPDSRLALAWLLGLLIVLLLLMAGPIAHGQSERQGEPPTLTALLEACEQNLLMLNSRLVERQAQVQTLRESLLRAEAKLIDSQESLTDLRARLVEAESSLLMLQTALQETQTSYSALSMQYGALETSWQAYRSEMMAQVKLLETGYARARRWAIGLGVSTAMGIVVSLVLWLR